MSNENASSSSDGNGLGNGSNNGAVNRTRSSTQFSIPPLKPNDRIEDWEPLFKAAVTGLLTHENGEALAIGLLPAHVNRRPAESELVQDAIGMASLNDAFTLLKTLDDPIDKYEMMQSLCRSDWSPGTPIDDFYYQLKKKARQAGANLDLVMSIVISQLPKKVQSAVKSEFTVQKGENAVISELGARLVLAKIKQTLQDHGIALNAGCKSFDGLIRAVSEEDKLPKAAGSNPVDEESSGDGSQVSYVEAYKNNGKSRNNNRQSYQNQQRSNSCYICGKGGHLQKIVATSSAKDVGSKDMGCATAETML